MIPKVLSDDDCVLIFKENTNQNHYIIKKDTLCKLMYEFSVSTFKKCLLHQVNIGVGGRGETVFAVFVNHSDKLSKNEDAAKVVILLFHPLSNHVDLNITENVSNIGLPEYSVLSFTNCFGFRADISFSTNQEYFCPVNVFLVWPFNCYLMLCYL